jgi:histone H3/H4
LEREALSVIAKSCVITSKESPNPLSSTIQYLVFFGSVSGWIYEETRGVIKVFLDNVIRDADTYTTRPKRKTVTDMDVVYGLKGKKQPF